MALTQAQRKSLSDNGIVDAFPKRKGIIGRSEGIDPEIVDVIIDLNKNGYKTLESCAGHKYGRMGDDGVILFNMWIGKHQNKIISIMEKHGLIIKKIYLKWSPAIYFEGIGQPYGINQKRVYNILRRRK